MSATATEERTSLLAQLAGEFFPFAPPLGPLPDPTPTEGPDPYGNPDPEWLRIDWREHLHQIDLGTPAGAELRPGHDGPTRVNYVEMGAGNFTVVLVHRWVTPFA